MSHPTPYALFGFRVDDRMISQDHIGMTEGREVKQYDRNTGEPTDPLVYAPAKCYTVGGRPHYTLEDFISYFLRHHGIKAESFKQYQGSVIIGYSCDHRGFIKLNAMNVRLLRLKDDLKRLGVKLEGSATIIPGIEYL
jgi:hypothetical protein